MADDISHELFGAIQPGYTAEFRTHGSIVTGIVTRMMLENAGHSRNEVTRIYLHAPSIVERVTIGARFVEWGESNGIELISRTSQDGRGHYRAYAGNAEIAKVSVLAAVRGELAVEFIEGHDALSKSGRPGARVRVKGDGEVYVRGAGLHRIRKRRHRPGMFQIAMLANCPSGLPDIIVNQTAMPFACE